MLGFQKHILHGRDAEHGGGPRRDPLQPSHDATYLQKRKLFPSSKVFCQHRHGTLPESARGHCVSGGRGNILQ